MTGIGWTELLGRQQVRRAAALEAARSLLDRDVAPAAALLGTWRFAGLRGLAVRVAEAIAREPPLPSAGALTAVLGAPDQLPALLAIQAEHLHRRTLAERCASQIDSTELHRVAWALDELAFLGAEVERRERAAWREDRFTESPGDDARAAALWARWLEGDPWSVRADWERAYLPAAERVFRQVLEAAHVPREARPGHLDDLREAFFYMLLGSGDGGGVPGWLDVATRVLETRAPGPVDACASCLSAAGWERAGAFAAMRGHFAESAAFAWPDRAEALSRARAFARACREDPSELESWLDLHVVLRLLSTWRQGGAPATAQERSWAVIVQNRGRARGRLRALLASEEERGGLAAALLATDALHERTLAATRRFAWAWAWGALSGRFSFGLARSVTPACEPAEAEGDGSIAPGDLAALRTWVLLVTLKGRLTHLLRWTRDGGTSDRDSTWARLLSDELPEVLRDAAQAGRRAGTYHRLRVELGDRLDGELSALEPLIARIAALEPGRGLRSAFTGVVGREWDPAVPLPKAGFPTFLENARKAHAVLREREDSPWDT